MRRFLVSVPNVYVAWAPIFIAIKFLNLLVLNLQIYISDMLGTSQKNHKTLTALLKKSNIDLFASSHKETSVVFPSFSRFQLKFISCITELASTIC